MSSSHPIVAQLARLEIKVRDAQRAARFFHQLFGLEPITEVIDGRAETRLVGVPTGTYEPIMTVLVDEAVAPLAQPVYLVASLEAVLARLEDLGGRATLRHPGRLDAIDDQGLRLGFTDNTLTTRSDDAPAVSGALGVTVLGVPKLDKARAFYTALFGWTYHLVGGPSRCWTDAVPATGLFQSVAPAVHHWFCVDDFEIAKDRTLSLGGDVVPRDPMGPYQICDCRDDQGTGFSLWCDPGT
jgi:uncharacterized protein